MRFHEFICFGVCMCVMNSSVFVFLHRIISRAELAAIHVLVCFFLIAARRTTGTAGRAAATAARLANDRLPLVIVVEPFNEVIN